MWKIIQPISWHSTRSRFLWFTVRGYKAQMVNILTGETQYRPVSKADLDANSFD